MKPLKILHLFVLGFSPKKTTVTTFSVSVPTANRRRLRGSASSIRCLSLRPSVTDTAGARFQFGFAPNTENQENCPFPKVIRRIVVPSPLRPLDSGR